MHDSSMDKMRRFYAKYLAHRTDESLKILDLGSYDVNGTYKDLLKCPTWDYVGLDSESGKNVDVVLSDPYCWREIPSASADVLISGQVFEHIEFFWISMLEVVRVLKPGGICCIIAPAGGHEHRYPVDCWRFYPDGFDALARFARLDVLEISTQWTPDPSYTDGSNEWQDSVLICQKPHWSIVKKFSETLRRFLLRKLMLTHKINKAVRG